LPISKDENQDFAAAYHAFHVSAAPPPPMVSCCWQRTSGIRNNSGSRLTCSSQRSSLRIAERRPSSAKRRDSRSTSAATPNFWAKRRSSPTDAAFSFRCTEWTLMRRSAKHRSAARVSALLRMPNICASTAPNIFPATMSPRSKIITAAVLFSSGGAAIKWCSFGGWQLAAFRASIAMLTILILLPEARRGWSWRTVVVGVAYAATTLLYVQANKHTTAASAIFLRYRWLAARGSSVAAAAVSGNLTAAILALVMAQPLVGGRPADWAVVVFLGVCQLGIPYLFLARAVPHVRALEIGLFLLIEPVLNPLSAWLVHGRRPGATTSAGGV